MLKATVTYTVNCSHTAFEHAMSKHMPGVKFHEVAWRHTGQWTEDDDTFSEFSWPNAMYPALTKDLFFLMASESIAFDGTDARFFVEAYVRDENGKQVCRIADSWMPEFCAKEASPPDLTFNESVASADMAERLRKIAKIAGQDD